MKRQARPFVVETKRSRKAPANLWASTPLLQQELAAAAVPEPRVDTVFADRLAEKSGSPRAAEPARRILQSLVAEAPSPVLEALASEEAEEASAPRRRARREDEDAPAEPARRGRPRRAAAVPDDESEIVAAAAPARIAVARKPAVGKGTQPKAAEPEIRAVAAASLPPASAAPETDTPEAPRAGRTRAARNPVAAALLPGERWKRRLPQRLW